MATDTTATATEVAARRGLTRRTARRLALAERLTYGVLGGWAAAAPLLDLPWWAHAPALASAATAALILKRAGRSEEPTGQMRAAMRAVPLGSWPLVCLAGHMAPVLDYSTAWPLLGAAAWSAAMAGMAPLTRSLGLAKAAADLDVDVALVPAVEAPVTYEDHLRAMWTRAQVTGETRLHHITQYAPDEPDFQAVVMAPPGQTLPTGLNERAVAAVFDVPVEAVRFADLPGHGPGRIALQVAPGRAAREGRGGPDGAAPATPGDVLEQIWAEHVNTTGGAANGVKLVKYDVGEDQIRLWIATARGKTLRVDHKNLCSALGIDDTSRLVVEGAGPREAIVYIYATNPLLDVRAPTVEDLTMDARGRISIGVAHDGSPARFQLFNFDTGRAQHGITAGTTGAGKSGLMRLLGAAQRISGVISWMADVQGGMSMPEMDGRIDYFAKGPEETMNQLRALHAVKVYRETHSTGRGDFDFDGPWRLIQWTGDEINRLLSSLDQKIRQEAAWMVADLQKTGQKVGIGVDLAVQSLHLKELGDNHEIREKGKEGHVFLLRTASSSTQGMSLDGIAPLDAHITPIPERIYEGGGAQAMFEGTAATEGVPTPGMGWLITEGKAVLFRTFVLEKVKGRYPQLEGLMDDCPMPTLTPAEAAAAGAAYTNRREVLLAAGLIAEELENTTGVPGTDDGNGASSSQGPTEEPENAADLVPTGPQAEAPSPMAVTAKGPTIAERILAALADQPQGLPLREIRKALGCGTDGGPTTGSVNNTVTKLAAEGALVPCGRGTYRLA